MRKLICLILIVCLCSCKKEETKSFDGFGELIVGKDFSKIPSYKLFEIDTTKTLRTDEKMFSLNKYELSKKFGIVEKINVLTFKGKIYSVSFCKGRFTNINAIESFISDGSTLKEAVSQRVTYSSNNGYIEAYIFQEKDLTGQTVINDKYGYYDLVVIDKIQNTYDSIIKVKQKREIERERKEYIKDLKKI